MYDTFSLIQRTLNTIIIGFLAIGFFIFAAADKTAPPKTEAGIPTSDGIYAVLRPDSNGNWYILDDAEHTPKGIKSIEQDNFRILLHFERPLTDIYWSAVSPDETLVVNNVDGGISVDYDKARIYLSKDGTHIDPNKINYEGGNLWVYINGGI